MTILQPVMMVFLATFMLKDFQVGILIGLGVQKRTIGINLLSYFMIGIPISIHLTFNVGWEYYGPWIGLTVSNVIN